MEATIKNEKHLKLKSQEIKAIKEDKLKKSYRATRTNRVSKTEEKSNHHEGLGGMKQGMPL